MAKFRILLNGRVKDTFDSSADPKNDNDCIDLLRKHGKGLSGKVTIQARVGNTWREVRDR